MINLFLLSLLSFLYSSLALSILANVTISSSPVFDVELNHTLIYYISRNAVYDT